MYVCMYIYIYIYVYIYIYIYIYIYTFYSQAAAEAWGAAPDMPAPLQSPGRAPTVTPSKSRHLCLFIIILRIATISITFALSNYQ